VTNHAGYLVTSIALQNGCIREERFLH